LNIIVAEAHNSKHSEDSMGGIEPLWVLKYGLEFTAC